MSDQTSVDVGVRRVPFTDGKGYVDLPSPIECDEVELVEEESRGDLQMNGVVLSPGLVSCGGLFVVHQSALHRHPPQSHVRLCFARRQRAGGGGTSEKEMADLA
jgi:hypothetical protein